MTPPRQCISCPSLAVLVCYFWEKKDGQEKCLKRQAEARWRGFLKDTSLEETESGSGCGPSGPAPARARATLQWYLGTFIHPSRCKLLLGSLLWRPGEFILSRQKASVKCVAYSAGRPQVAGKQVEHLGWHMSWHSRREQGTV